MKSTQNCKTKGRPQLFTNYAQYAEKRLSGSFGEMGSWPLVLPFIKEKRTLDIGCSDGLYLRYLSHESVGIEQLPKLAHAARKKGLTVINADTMDGLKETSTSSYEAVLFSHVMEHIESPIAALREINRVLKKEGVLVLGLPIENCLVRHVLGHDYFDGTHLYAFTIRNARKLLSLTGFRVKEVLFHLPKFKGKYGRKLNRVWNFLPIPFKEYFSMAYWIVAIKEKDLSG
ncbi:MAG: class I SAM-dependent methyltransferase [Proteobacteria bacterium]|nr:class I SAM-dependent methyltransferase [Desulfobacteraceae bacterium]MBU4014276.1 class I SAM-dependent methyltransferase [Pseudomonadota bacterium]MBU4067902.1 class I SAM-dependent methyltransferase [Pseudomonadota bacterium]MBU4103428.1 class I SAM-dependent methyltransferase [Patescibacteria group bacterium]